MMVESEVLQIFARHGAFIEDGHVMCKRPCIQYRWLESHLEIADERGGAGVPGYVLLGDFPRELLLALVWWIEQKEANDEG